MNDEPPETTPVPPAVVEPRGERELPVVARLVVEVRSDGTRTIARGALEDVTTGQRTTIEARGDSPLALAASLARVLLRVPALARRAAQALLPDRRRR